MNFNPPPSATQNSDSSSQYQSSGVRPVRRQQSAWGLPAPGAGTRRGLTPLSTTLGSSSADLGGTKNTPSSSPFGSTFSSVLNSSIQHDNTRGSHSSSFSTSPFPILQSGSQQAQPSQLLSSPRSRAITPSSNTQSASSAAASTAASQAGGGGGSGGGGSFTRNQTFSPPLPQHSLSSPTINAFDRPGYSGSTSSCSASGQSSVSKIVAAQIFLLLGSITEKEGKVKWESQAEAIRKLVESNSMENFPKYFRRLLAGNSPHIFPGINRSVENPGNYQMLVQEMEKISQDPEQASRIAEAIDTAEGDVFRDFDLSTLMQHFKLNALAKTLLASAFTHVSRQDLRSKAAVILENAFVDLAKVLANSENDEPDVAPRLLATCALRYLHSTPSSTISERHYQKITYALNLRYKKLNIELPHEIQSLYTVMDLDQTGQDLYNEVCQAGPRITASVDAAKAFLASRSDELLDERQVSGVILLMAMTPDWQPFDAAVFVAAVREYVEQTFDWSEVVRGFDRVGLQVSKEQFLTLYKALLPVAKAEPDFDIQMLWGGQWQNTMPTQFSFINSFLGCLPSEVDASTIPGLRQAYDPQGSLDHPESIAKEVDLARRDTMISLDAVMGLLDICLPLNSKPTQQSLSNFAHAVGDKTGLFLCSSVGAEKSDVRQQLMQAFMQSYLKRQRADYLYVLHTLWRLDKRALATSLVEAHLDDPLELTTILELALEFGWLDDLLTLMTGFAFDLAALAHRSGLIDFTQWAEGKLSLDKTAFVNALSRFVAIKAQDELRISRDEQPVPHTVSLSMQTAYDMLAILDEHMQDRVELKAIQRTFLQAYPRLILLCEGIHDNIDVDCKQSNAMPRSADAEMQELYKKMYGKDLEVPKVIEYLGKCKESNDPAELDLFACMIHGLFDEYSCFSEYPLDPLQKTALLFGGIVKVRLVSDLTLRVAREMVLDSVNDYPPDASMFKFGLQALATFADRLQEPEWSNYCRSLVRIPGLRNTQIYVAAMDALEQNGIQPGSGEPIGAREVSDCPELTNGNLEDFDAETMAPHFRSVNAGPEPTCEDPDEGIKDKIVFFFNNVSQQNLGSKFHQLSAALQEDYHGWFADFLVNGRAKVEPNYQPLYLEMLIRLENKALWSEVLRSTYFVIQKLLNSESTANSASERKNLKSLAIWLGSLTLAQDKPIKRKNISFLDLLVEGYQLDRLVLVIPFTCNVLAQGKKSTVFKPPNPWLMEILEALVELYHEVNITTNQKFDIEVLCDELGLDMKSIEPSRILLERPADINEQVHVMIPDGIRAFDNLSLGGLNGSVQNPRFDVGAMQFDLPDLEPLLKFPPANGSAASQARLRQVVLEAVTHAIYDIIGSVVERSVTIATIATSNLIHKDFACEADENNVRQAAQQMVRQLASSLALATSKDPLKTSMTNFIRKTQTDSPEHAFPEGTILMCVNDNLEIACGIVEAQAAAQSMPEIESHIESEIIARRQHKAEHPNEPFIGPAHNRWGTCISDPYKLTADGLNEEQMDIYREFARQPKGATNHAQTSSADSGRQLPDVLQDTFSSMPHIPTPADNMAMPHQVIPPQQYQQQRGRMLPPLLPASVTQTQTNGYIDPAMIEERVVDQLTDIRRLAKQYEGRSDADFQREPALGELLHQIWDMATSHDTVAMSCAEDICKCLYSDSTVSAREIEIFVDILARLSQTFPNISREVAHWADTRSDGEILATDVTVDLLVKGIMQLRKVDESLANLINQRDESAIEALSTIVDRLLLNAHPSALRADFAKSLGALALWYCEDDRMSAATEIWNKLNNVSFDDDHENIPDERGMIKKHQINYVFSEWIRLCEQSSGNPNDKVFAAFIVQMQMKKLLQSPEDMALFLRLCIDAAILTYEISQQEERQGQRSQKDYSSRTFLEVDWLTRLIVCLVKSQGGTNGLARNTKASYMDSILSLITLIMNHHQVTRAEHFNQRVFFRLLSGILCDWHDFAQVSHTQNEQMLFVFANNFLTMGPYCFPGFIYSWLALISHRFFMPSLLKLADDEGYDAFTQIMEAALSYVPHFLKPGTLSPVAAELYSGLLRIITLLHHDFPEFLAENHYRLCNAIPPQCTQLLNLILSACPSSFPELRNPFATGLRIDRLEEIRRAPRINGDFVSSLVAANVKSHLDTALKSTSIEQEIISSIADAVYINESTGLKVDTRLMPSIVLYIGQSATAAASQRGSSAFVADSPPASLLEKLSKELRADARFHLLMCMVNQLRWPNAHTQYFAYALLHLFGTESGIQDRYELREQIVALVLHRLHVVKPHPWGLVVLMLELLKNPDYNFWQLAFVKNSPQDTALTPFRAAVSKGAQRAYLGTALFTATSFFLLVVASVAFWLFYYSYVPQLGVEREVWLQFGDGHPHGATTFPGVLVSYQVYDISLVIHLPRTTNNLHAGNFMLDLSLLPTAASSTISRSLLPASIALTNKTIAQSRRSAILTYTSPLTTTASTLAFLPFYILGLNSESETLVIPMFEGVVFTKGAGEIPQAARVSIEADEKMQFYKARLRIIAKLGGLRWVLYNHRILSFLVFTTAFWASSVLSMGIVWLFLSIYLDAESKGKGKLAKKEESDTDGSAIKSEPTPDPETFDPTSLEDLSDTARTFPTFSHQKPLHYTPREAEQVPIVKIEEHMEDAPVQSLAAAAVEADDEDNFEEASSAWRDSGIGTSLEDERRAGVHRRRKALMGSGVGR
ncbi:MAG: hypothetical protein Q9217_002029 [Psora testacea]